MQLPFKVGALYSRQDQIHSQLGGQERGGISTPKDYPVVIAFTGEAGVTHLYPDFVDDHGVLHYFGEGQHGDMRYTGGNRALQEHAQRGKKLIVFQSMGKGRPYRYLGEFSVISSYYRDATVDASGLLRKAIVFRMQAVLNNESASIQEDLDTPASVPTPGDTSRKSLIEVRTKQRLFRDRVIRVEKGCRFTGIEDLRFLRASHIKPWAISNEGERVDGHNGLLLAPHIDHLFDSGWITFDGDGKLVVATDMPPTVEELLRLNLRRGSGYGNFTDQQRRHLEFHRNVVFEKFLRKQGT